MKSAFHSFGSIPGFLVGICVLAHSIIVRQSALAGFTVDRIDIGNRSTRGAGHPLTESSEEK